MSEKKSYVRTARKLTHEVFWIRSNPKLVYLPINFNVDDKQGVICPHCDALVVRFVIARSNLNCILVDDDSSVNILFGGVLTKCRFLEIHG